MPNEKRDSRNAEPGAKRDSQLRVFRKIVKEDSWIAMLLRRRREDKGKPKRQSRANKPWFRESR